MDIEVRVFHQVSEVDPILWDRLSAGRPFASHRWYRFGETVMADCEPVFIGAFLQSEMIARATFWVVRNEPLPIPWAPARVLFQSIMQRWPLFICRSPLSNWTGLILPDPPLRRPVLAALARTAVQEAKKYAASFLLFDFLAEGQAGWEDWPGTFSRFSFSDPGTLLEITWPKFEDYLEDLNTKARKHYRQHNREAGRLGIQVKQQNTVTDIEEVLPIIQDVEIRHHSSPNPWIRKMLENIGLVGGVWLTASLNGQIEGCELILEDNGAVMVASLGLANRVSHIYHLLGYKDIQYAIEIGARCLRWGSGAYETKRRLGFKLEDNNYLVFCGLNPLSRLVARMVA